MILIAITVPSKFLSDVYSKNHWYLLQEENFLIWAEQFERGGHFATSDYDHRLMEMSDLVGQDVENLRKTRAYIYRVNTRADLLGIIKEVRNRVELISL